MSIRIGYIVLYIYFYLIMSTILRCQSFRRSLNTLARPTSRTFTSVLASVPPLSFPTNPSIKDAYSLSVNWLKDARIEDPEDSARHMITHAAKIGYKRSDFERNLDKQLTALEVAEYTKMCEQRMRHTPVQYIIGNWDFYGMTLTCRPPILIPRPETEELVENILNTGILQKLKAPRILDVGAGTGAVGLALATQLPNAFCCAIDINAEAVQLATENAKSILGSKHSDRYQCVHADFRSFVSAFAEHCKSTANKGTASEDGGARMYQPFDVIVSNPPYIPRARISTLQPEIRDFENPRALDGGLDGLDIVRDLVYLAPTLLGSNSVENAGREMWLEVSEEHPAMIEEWMRTSYGADKEKFLRDWQSAHGGAGGSAEVFSGREASFVSGLKDLGGNPRFVRLRY
jgi:release factor glutamine methyltransferase